MMRFFKRKNKNKISTEQLERDFFGEQKTDDTFSSANITNSTNDFEQDMESALRQMREHVGSADTPSYSTNGPILSQAKKVPAFDSSSASSRNNNLRRPLTLRARKMREQQRREDLESGYELPGKYNGQKKSEPTGGTVSAPFKDLEDMAYNMFNAQENRLLPRSQSESSLTQEGSAIFYPATQEGLKRKTRVHATDRSSFVSEYDNASFMSTTSNPVEALKDDQVYATIKNTFADIGKQIKSGVQRVGGRRAGQVNKAWDQVTHNAANQMIESLKSDQDLFNHYKDIVFNSDKSPEDVKKNSF